MTTNYNEMSDFEIEVEVTKILFPFVLDDGYTFCGSRDGFIYSREDRKEHKSSGNRLICTIKNYCNNPQDAWPIIIDNGIALFPRAIREDLKLWQASAPLVGGFRDENPLRAAMICFLKVKEVENGN